MSICDNFEGALMKAIRSLEQHVDCLLSYDFSDLDDDALIKQLKVVDDRRIWLSLRLSAAVLPMRRSTPSQRSTSGSSIRLPSSWRWSRP